MALASVLLIDTVVGIVSGLAGDELRKALEQRKYSRGVRRRATQLYDRVRRAHDDSGAALLLSAAECVEKAAFTLERITAAALNPTALFTELEDKFSYSAKIQSIPSSDHADFADFCKRILGFICRELSRFDGAHNEITSEILRKTDSMDHQLSSLSASASRQSEAERRRDELEVERFLAAIEQHLRVHEFASAYQEAEKLREWLGRKGEPLAGYLAAQVYVVLAEVEVVRAKNALDDGEPVDLSTARSFVTNARAANQDTLGDRIDALDAYMVYLEQGPDAGLQMLVGRSDPHSRRRRLLILRQTGRTSEAATLARGLSPNAAWCDHAVFAFAAEGDQRSADRLLTWCNSQDDVVIRDRCLLAYAHGSYETLQRKYFPDGMDSPGAVPDEGRKAFTKIVSTLEPITLAASALGRVKTQLEAWAIEVAILAQLQASRQSDCSSMVRLLATYTPVPLALATLALERQIDAPVALVERLRDEHPTSFKARLLAVAAERKLLKKPRDAFGSAMDLVGQAERPDQREDLGRLLVEITQDLGDEEREEVRRLAPSLLSEGNQFMRLMEVDSLLRAGKTREAGDLLDELRDESDHVWLQMYAGFLGQSGEPDKGLDYLEKAAGILPHPDVLWRVAAIAHHLGRFEEAADALRSYLVIRPRDVQARTNLAMICLDKGDFRAAAVEFSILQGLEPDNLSHAYNRATALATIMDTAGASAVLDAALKGRDVPLHFLLQRAQLALSSGQPEEALGVLKASQDRYWDQHEFLLQFMRLGFASGDEAAAHEALRQLQQMKSDGKLPEEVMQQASLDNLVERFKQHKKQSDHIHSEMLRGRASWLMAEEHHGRAPYLGWWIRTQQVDWLGDEPIHRAQYTIYSSNAYMVSEDEDGHSSLAQIRCPVPGTTVVVDLSALITLHQLGLLNAAAGYFDKIMIPAVYQLSALHDSASLVPHQLSVVAALKEIKGLVVAGRVSVTPGPQTPDVQPPIPCVDEYLHEAEAEDCYRLRDVFDALRLAGRISDKRYDELLRIAHEPARADSDHPAIYASQGIQIGLSTLRALSQASILQEVAGAFPLFMTSQDHSELVAGLEATDKQDQVRRWHMDLWDTIRQDSRFVTAAHFTPPEFGTNDHKVELDVSFAGYFLARQLDMPLLVDDRMWQMATLNEGRVSFSTDHLLVALREAELLTVDKLSDCLLELMRRRYRFIVPPPEVLKHLAGQYSVVPAKPLQEVALHAHDCMRDPGLFAGLEATEPPQTMAFHLFQEWVSSILDFVVEVWGDDTFEDRAGDITEWAMTELLPTLPSAFSLLHRARIAELVRHTALTRAILKSVSISNAERANAAVQAVAQALAIDPMGDDYLRLVAGVVDAMNWELQDLDGTEALVRSLVLQRAFLHRAVADARTVTVLIKNGFRLQLQPDASSVAVIAALEDANHVSRFSLTPGPLIAYRDNSTSAARTVVSAADYLFSPDKTARLAAHAHFERLAEAESNILAGKTKAAITALKGQLNSDDDITWQSAAISIHDEISGDLMCNLAGVRQGLQMRLEHIPYLPKVLSPTASSLSSLMLPVGKPLEEQEKITRVIAECAEAASLQDACDHYYKHLGYLPLAGQMSMARVVDDWLALREKNEQAWSLIWAWADRTHSPIARYHACGVFLGRPDLAPRDRISDLWSEVTEIIHPDAEISDRKWGMAWELRCRLARHYTCYVECIFPGVDSERAAAAAWWLSGNVSMVFESVPELASFFLSEADGELRASGLLNSIAHPPTAPSALRHATMHLSSLWSLSLQCLFGAHLDRLEPVRAGAQPLADIGSDIVRSVFCRFPVQSKPSDEAVYSFELSLLPAFAISDYLTRDSDDRTFLEALGHIEQDQKQEELSELLEKMPTQAPEVQYFLANDLLARARTGNIPEDTLWGWISANDWVKNVLPRLDTKALGVLLDVILDMQVRVGGKWVSYVPHLFAHACELAADDEDRRQLMFGATIVSSMASDVVSAISRLMHTRAKQSCRAEVEYWRAQFRGAYNVAPAWIAARMRATLAGLRDN